MLTVLLAGLVGTLVANRLQLTDPYRPGTSHRVTMYFNGCANPSDLYLDGRTWTSDDSLPVGWPTDATPRVETGTLEVIATDTATFTADRGGSVTERRLAPNEFSVMRCHVA